MCRYLLLYRTAPQLLKIWVPLVVFAIYAGILVIEARIAYAFANEIDCSKTAC